jgi:hypothetical protein
MIRNPLVPILFTLSLECTAWAQIPFFPNNSILNSLQSITDSTSPANGDLNPYGVAFVPANFPSGGTIAPGDVLVSNFNNSSNLEGTGTTIVSISPTLHGPLGLTLSPNGNLITANGDGVNAGGPPNDLVEFTEHGFLVSTYQLDGGAPGAAFGVASALSQGMIRFAAVDDDLNTLTIWNLRPLF